MPETLRKRKISGKDTKKLFLLKYMLFHDIQKLLHCFVHEGKKLSGPLAPCVFFYTFGVGSF